MLIAGLQVPVIPLLEAVGKVNVPPTQMAATWVNVGVTAGLIVIDAVLLPAALQASAVTE